MSNRRAAFSPDDFSSEDFDTALWDDQEIETETWTKIPDPVRESVTRVIEP